MGRRGHGHRQLRADARRSGARGRLDGSGAERHEFGGRRADLEAGTDAQKKKYLTRLSRGEILGAFCLTEPQAGSDAAGIQTRAVRDGDHYVLNGTKTWVTNGGVAGVYIVFAKTDPAAGARGVTAFLVEPDFPGFRISRYEDKMGLRLSRSAEISLAGLPRARRESPGRRGAGAEESRSKRSMAGAWGSPRRPWASRKARSKRRCVTPSSARRSASPSPNIRRFNGCWRTCKRKSKRRAR